MVSPAGEQANGLAFARGGRCFVLTVGHVVTPGELEIYAEVERGRARLWRELPSDLGLLELTEGGGAICGPTEASPPAPPEGFATRGPWRLIRRRTDGGLAVVEVSLLASGPTEWVVAAPGARITPGWSGSVVWLDQVPLGLLQSLSALDAEDAADEGEPRLHLLRLDALWPLVEPHLPGGSAQQTEERDTSVSFSLFPIFEDSELRHDDPEEPALELLLAAKHLLEFEDLLCKPPPGIEVTISTLGSSEKRTVEWGPETKRYLAALDLLEASLARRETPWVRFYRALALARNRAFAPALAELARADEMFAARGEGAARGIVRQSVKQVESWSRVLAPASFRGGASPAWEPPASCRVEASATLCQLAVRASARASAPPGSQAVPELALGLLRAEAERRRGTPLPDYQLDCLHRLLDRLAPEKASLLLEVLEKGGPFEGQARRHLRAWSRRELFHRLRSTPGSETRRRELWKTLRAELTDDERLQEALVDVASRRSLASGAGELARTYALEAGLARRLAELERGLGELAPLAATVEQALETDPGGAASAPFRRWFRSLPGSLSPADWMPLLRTERSRLASGHALRELSGGLEALPYLPSSSVTDDLVETGLALAWRTRDPEDRFELLRKIEAVSQILGEASRRLSRENPSLEVEARFFFDLLKLHLVLAAVGSDSEGLSLWSAGDETPEPLRLRRLDIAALDLLDGGELFRLWFAGAEKERAVQTFLERLAGLMPRFFSGLGCEEGEDSSEAFVDCAVARLGPEIESWLDDAYQSRGLEEYPELRRLYELLRTARRQSLSRLRGGTTAAEADRAYTQALVEALDRLAADSELAASQRQALSLIQPLSEALQGDPTRLFDRFSETLGDLGRELTAVAPFWLALTAESEGEWLDVPSWLADAFGVERTPEDPRERGRALRALADRVLHPLSQLSILVHPWTYADLEPGGIAALLRGSRLFRSDPDLARLAASLILLAAGEEGHLLTYEQLQVFADFVDADLRASYFNEWPLRTAAASWVGDIRPVVLREPTCGSTEANLGIAWHDLSGWIGSAGDADAGSLPHAGWLTQLSCVCCFDPVGVSLALAQAAVAQGRSAEAARTLRELLRRTEAEPEERERVLDDLAEILQRRDAPSSEIFSLAFETLTESLPPTLETARQLRWASALVSLLDDPEFLRLYPTSPFRDGGPIFELAETALGGRSILPGDLDYEGWLDYLDEIGSLAQRSRRGRIERVYQRHSRVVLEAVARSLRYPTFEEGSLEITGTESFFASAGNAAKQRQMALGSSAHQAVQELERRREAGDALAACHLARLALLGGRKPPDPERARALFTEAAELSHPCGLLGLGSLLTSRGQFYSPEEGLRWLEKARSRGSTEAAVLLGHLARAPARGSGRTDFRRALDLYRWAGEAGDPEGWLQEALLRLELDFQGNAAAARRLLARAEAGGHPVAASLLARLGRQLEAAEAGVSRHRAVPSRRRIERSFSKP